VGARFLEARQLVPVAVVVVDTTTSQLVTTRAVGLVVVGNSCVPCHTAELSDSRLATTDVHGVVAPPEAHISPPAVVAMRERLLEPSAGVEMPVVVVDTTTSHCVTARESCDAHAAAFEADGAGGAVERTMVDLTNLIVAIQLAWPEASVASEVVALGHHLLKGRLRGPTAIAIVHTTTGHGVATVWCHTDDASIVRVGRPCGTGELILGVHTDQFPIHEPMVPGMRIHP